ncbi:hypothetical protein ACFVKC_40540 [Streptomyces noursei]
MEKKPSKRKNKRKGTPDYKRMVTPIYDLLPAGILNKLGFQQ